MGNDRERFSKKVKFEETKEDTYFGDKEEELIRGIEARVLAGRRQAGKTDSELSEAPRETREL